MIFSKTIKVVFNNLACFQDSITAADISIWSALYPLYKDSNKSKEYLGGLENILRWMKMLEAEKQFRVTTIPLTSSFTVFCTSLIFILFVFIQDATTTFKIDPTSSYSALLNGAKYLYSSTETEQQKKVKDSPHHEAYPKEKESPQHCVESLTEEEIAAAQNAWQKNLNQLPKKKVRKGAV